MPSGLWLRAFAALVVAILPPLIALAALLLGWPAFDGFDPFATGIAIVGGAIAWAAVLAVIYARSLGDEFRELVSVARGGSAPGGGEPGVAQQQLANLLDERNRQVATLAQQASRAPIEDDPVRVVRSVITAVESVMGDATWRGAVLASDDASILAPGIYDSGDGVPVQPLTDLERWAAATDPTVPVRHVAGPLGAFTVVDAAVSSGNRVILYAPWEGRVPPTAAERDLLRLVGQHAGTSIDHALLYARVRSQADELNRLAGVQADFLRGVTHDLQTPLTSIGAVAAELRADPSVPAAAQADLDTVSHQADRLRRLVAQLLVASRLEAGAFSPQTDVFAVRPLVERTWAALRADRPFELTESGPPHLAVADPDRLEQVLWAMFDNAVKYSPAGSAIDVTIDAGSDAISIAIRDRGSGMDPEARTHAFDQFYRSPHARKAAPDGSGVGLYAARGLVEAMDGTIAVASTLGAGTTITIGLPAEPVAPRAAE